MCSSDLASNTTALYSRNIFDAGISLAGGLEFAFEAIPAKVAFQAVAAAWNHEKFNVGINSNFKYQF